MYMYSAVLLLIQNRGAYLCGGAYWNANAYSIGALIRIGALIKKV